MDDPDTSDEPDDLADPDPDLDAEPGRDADGDGRTYIEQVPGALSGERLDRVVSLVTGLSRRDASTLVAAGAVLVNDAPVTGRAHRLVEGDRLVVRAGGDGAPPELQPSPDIEVEIVHVDDDVIVVDKPPGLVVHPGAGNASGTLIQGLLARYPELAGVGPDPARPGIVHRIDRDTSGLLVVARSARAFDSLVEQLSERTVERRYTGLVWGHFESPAGEIDGPIARSHRDPLRMTVSAAGKEARTGYAVERAFADPVEVTLVGCRLFTGRTHQIRVHMRSIGHPVVGDHRYGGYRQSLEAPRLFLHAATLGFRHPGTGEVVRFEAELPADLTGVLDGLR